MNLIISALFILTTLSFNIAFEPNDFTQFRTWIHNAMEENISLHVYQEGRDDYGRATLGFQEKFTWKCGVHFGTHVVGEFWWGEKYTHISVYNGDVFKLCFDGNIFSTQHCYWKVQSDGFYISRYNRTDPKYWNRWHTW
ncbi:plant self-incompatibility S1 [Artemisia annua]|uniref:Plant self-incompatibility S1 n=1 Tax=Artemisia annua TaxID=35608 RepID=A0A2U1KVD4_ARTAN|nr:plant self-incompatibility S1 [Artemisia annua]